MCTDHAAKYVGVDRKTILYWRSEYNEFLNVERYGRPWFDSHDITTLQVIKNLLHEELYSVLHVKMRLRKLKDMGTI